MATPAARPPRTIPWERSMSASSNGRPNLRGIRRRIDRPSPRRGRIISVIPRPMKFLFVHQYFPGQYVHLVQHLQEAGHNVVFVTQRRGREIPGVRTLESLPLPPSGAIPPHLQEVEIGVMNGLAVARLCEGLKREGFTPDMMIGHCGWGEVLFVKDVWPSVPLLGYFEFFYRVAGSDMDFDPEFPPPSFDPTRIRVRNTINLMSLDAAEWGQTPTAWGRGEHAEQ